MFSKDGRILSTKWAHRPDRRKVTVLRIKRAKCTPKIYGSATRLSQRKLEVRTSNTKKYFESESLIGWLKLGLGTSPPQSNMAQSLASSNPKSLLSCLSCPGSSEPNEPLLDSAKTSHTVPPSPGPTNQRGGYLEFPLSRPTTLPSSVGSLQPLAGKPPQSPTQTSPRLARHVSKGITHTTCSNEYKMTITH